MKNFVVIVLLVAVVVLGGVCLNQSRQAARAQANAETLQRTVAELQADLAEQEKKATRLQNRLQDTRTEADVKSREVASIREALEETLTNQTRLAAGNAGETTNGKPSNPFAEMFKSPEMKEIIRNQQKGALGAMIDKNYARLFASLHLPAEKASALKDMLLNKQLEAAEMGMSMFSGDSDATRRADMVRQVKAASDAADAQIKDFLGPDDFAQLQGYEKSMGERMAVSGFKDQLSAGAGTLSGDQEQRLIQAMTEERQNFKFTADLGDKSKFDGDFASMFNEDKIGVYFQEMEKLNQQYVSRAQGILPPDQAAAFEKYLNNQQTLQKAGMQMAAKMFAPAKAHKEQ